MENVTQALLIAAGVLVGLMILSMMIIGYNEISDYYTQKEVAKKTEQLAKFNEEYARYNRDDVRGSDLLSLINKIIDFNATSDDEDITISIDISAANNIYYGGSRPTDSTKRLFDTNVRYTATNIGTILQQTNNIEEKYPRGKAKKLAENLFTLMEESTVDEDAEEAREELFEQLKLDYNKSQLATYQKDILKYYQYMYFKRAHFDCTNLQYASNGRVQGLEFKFNGKYE